MNTPNMNAPEVRHAAMVTAVRAHASANYEVDGWDIVVETMSDDEICTIVRRCHNEAGAIRKMASYIRPIANVRADIQGA